MEFSGHSGNSWKTSTLPMRWLFSPTSNNRCRKRQTIADNLARLGLTINRGWSKVFRANASNNTPIMVQGEALEEVDSVTYLGSILDNQG
ncbi:hypothetical protein DPMN_087291 [Dreissena polymorpha]|uniref:Uncharacterized protein n=1 Tax=Dreissena polymorpha TaxID=45954 RepID=A0A9D4KTL4_DREPO|nr:hypothetical protein DPMN_087291 [Dreissena polymorpha]